MRQKQRTSCETCAFYVYDEEYGAYLCDMNMDEDDYVRIMSERYFQCPYYRNGDDYAVVRKQKNVAFGSDRGLTDRTEERTGQKRSGRGRFCPAGGKKLICRKR